MMKLKIKNFTHISSVLFISILFNILSILLFLQASAQETEMTETITYIGLEINENGIVEVTQYMELLAQETIHQADTIIPKAKNIEIYDSNLDSKLEYGSVIKGDEEIINFYLSEPLNAGEKKNITIKYSTEFFTNKQGETWEISFLLRLSNKSSVKVIFPENVAILFTSSDIVPLIYVENSRQVLELESIGDEIDFLCEYRFMEVQEPIDEQGLIQTRNETNETAQGLIQTKNETPKVGEEGRGLLKILTIIVIIILIVILAAILYYFKLKKSDIDEKKQKEKIKEPRKQKKVNSSIIGLLDENERSVVELLQSMSNEITQAHIRKSTKIPGSTLSKVMLRLEERNIIERREEGKTKWVKLKEWVFQ